VACMKNIAIFGNYNAIHVNRSDTLTKWLGPILTRLTTVGVMSYRMEPACSPRADVGIPDNFVKIEMHRFSAIFKKFLSCKGAAIRRFNEFETDVIWLAEA
jgi:hypothetical protein